MGRTLCLRKSARHWINRLVCSPSVEQLAAIVLSLLLPAKRDPIFEQARTFAQNRIILGLHYPSDVASGWTAGTLAAKYVFVSIY